MLWPKASPLDLDFGLCAWAKIFNTIVRFEPLWWFNKLDTQIYFLILIFLVIGQQVLKGIWVESQEYKVNLIWISCEPNGYLMAISLKYPCTLSNFEAHAVSWLFYGRLVIIPMIDRNKGNPFLAGYQKELLQYDSLLTSISLIIQSESHLKVI